jgi:hypothetical protein
MNYRLHFELMKFSELQPVAVTVTRHSTAATTGVFSRSKQLVTGSQSTAANYSLFQPCPLSMRLGFSIFPLVNVRFFYQFTLYL